MGKAGRPGQGPPGAQDASWPKPSQVTGRGGAASTRLDELTRPEGWADTDPPLGWTRELKKEGLCHPEEREAEARSREKGLGQRSTGEQPRGPRLMAHRSEEGPAGTGRLSPASPRHRPRGGRLGRFFTLSLWEALPSPPPRSPPPRPAPEPSPSPRLYSTPRRIVLPSPRPSSLTPPISPPLILPRPSPHSSHRPPPVSPCPAPRPDSLPPPPGLTGRGICTAGLTAPPWAPQHTGAQGGTPRPRDSPGRAREAELGPRPLQGLRPGGGPSAGGPSCLLDTSLPGGGVSSAQDTPTCTKSPCRVRAPPGLLPLLPPGGLCACPFGARCTRQPAGLIDGRPLRAARARGHSPAA